MNNDLALSHLFCENHASDAASILVRLSPEYVAVYFASLSPAQGINLIQHMPTAYATQLLSFLENDFSARLLAAADFTTAARLLRPLSTAQRQLLLTRTDAARTAQLLRILNYAPGSVGNLVEIPPLTALGDWTVKHTQQELKKLRHRSLFHIPVVDDEHRFLGSVTFHALLTARDSRRLDEICEARELAFPASTTTASILQHPAWEKTLSIPVIDHGGILLGLLHRSVINANIRGSSTLRAQEIFAPVMALAELYWAASSSIISIIENKNNHNGASA